VGKGQKGKGSYVFERDIDSEYEEYKKNKVKGLDEQLIYLANSRNSNFYEAGDAVNRKYKSSLSTIDTLQLSDEEKENAKNKVYELSSAELKERAKYIDVYTAGPARLTNTGSHLEKATSISAEHTNYMNSLKHKSEARIENAKEKERAKVIREAMNNGQLEVSFDGKNYFRTTRGSGTWREGSLADYKAEKKFKKAQEKLPLAKQKAWSSLSDDEKQVYYRAIPNDEADEGEDTEHG